MVLLLAWSTGLVSLDEALAGFGSLAVPIVAAALLVGRAVEYTGGAQTMTTWFVPNVRFVSFWIAGVLLMGMLLSAFMNDIAALAITMLIALNIAREHKLPAGAVLMPPSFATILGGMTPASSWKIAARLPFPAAESEAQDRSEARRSRAGNRDANASIQAAQVLTRRNIR